MKLFNALLLLLLFTACKQEKAPVVNQLPAEAIPPVVETTKQISGFSAPESVATDNSFFYISNVGEKLQPTVKDGDGYISQVKKNGEIVEQKYITGLDAPKGMVVVNNVLYVADIDKIRGFSLLDKKKIFELDLSSDGVTFLNDMTIVDEETFLVSGTDVGKIYEVKTAKEGSFRVLDIEGDLSGVNGLFYSTRTRQLFTNSFGSNNQPTGQIGIINMAAKKPLWKPQGEYKGALDGLKVIGGNTILFSDWNVGGLKFMDLTDKVVHPVELPATIKGPADFYYDETTKSLWLPMMQENKVLKTHIKL